MASAVRGEPGSQRNGANGRRRQQGSHNRDSGHRATSEVRVTLTRRLEPAVDGEGSLSVVPEKKRVRRDTLQALKG
jgi:hypothetical protein